MSLHSATVLALVLCLGWTINTQHESLPSPSILADPGLEISQGHSVKFVCTSPVEYNTFRLEKRSIKIVDMKNDLPSKKQAIFQLGPVNEDTAGSYHCLYKKGSMWSQRSETLELKVTSEDVTHTSDPVPGVTSAPTLQSYKVWNGIRMALAGVVFLVLGAIIGEAWYNQQKYMDSFRTPGGYNQGD
ncbi:leukocyte-associated immunoglobulin-like receptor 1 [Microtus ochrogaster]|uniref:Leukocyte-associated immunoglobulin-like receptor 1 n=1 Tax=Microtus ochrogaster TaxID=79684 RepID=A0ABM1TWH7_MICOH|nr:leukocyte-associated immunoglobulin-like receptor 1 [Microtus ochrogaster]